MAAQLKFEIDNQIISRLDRFEAVAMSRNYLRAVFYFPQEWGNGDKIAIFHSGTGTYKMILDEKGECYVPWEAIKTCGTLYVSVYSGDLITANMAEVPILATGYTNWASWTQDPTRDMYTVLKEMIEGLDLGLTVENGILCAVYDDEEGCEA